MNKDTDWPKNKELASMPCALQAAAVWLEVAQDAQLFRIGQRPRTMFYVLSGEMRLTRTSLDGAEIILQRTRCGFLAEASIETSAYHCDAVAFEPVTALGFPIAIFLNALEVDVTFRKAWTSNLVQEIRRARARSERLTLKSAAKRVLHFLESEGQNGVLKLEQSRKTWSAELGLSHEALYRTLARLEKEGVISVKDNTIRLACEMIDFSTIR